MAQQLLRASIVVIGDELLGGFVRDSNSHFLAQRLRAHGVPLDRVQVVPDEYPAIDEALQAELARSRPRLVLTTGGIGSTPDDITFEAVARSLGREVVEEPRIAERLESALSWTRSQGLEVDDEARHQFFRMARVPAGATMLSAGSWVPAVRLDLDGGIDDPGGATVVVLPGVPAQTRELVTSAVEPALLDGRNPAWTFREVHHTFPESVLNPTFLRLAERHPDVKLGSYPGTPMVVRLQGEQGEVEAAAAFVREQVEQLEATEAGERIAASWARRLGSDDASDGDAADADAADADANAADAEDAVDEEHGDG